MKTSFWSSIVFVSMMTLFAFGSGSSAQKSFGIGFMFGEPNGISAINWLGRDNALHFGLGFRTGHEGYIRGHFDYTWNFDLLPIRSGRMPFYVGLGLKTRIPGEVNVAARIPLGIDYIFARAPIDVFLEIVPTIGIIPGTDWSSVDAALGARFYF